MVLKMNKNQIARGSVWLVDLEPITGHEQGSKRPCLVVSDNLFNNSAAKLIAILPITKKFRPLVWYIQLDPPAGGLIMRSYIITNQVRVVSTDRFIGSSLGNVSAAILKEVDARLRLLLNL